MILVDTSVWIDHLHRVDAALVDLLERDEVFAHPLVIEELGLGTIRDRGEVLSLLANLAPAPMLDHGEVMELVASHRLWGRGLSAVDTHLLGSALLGGGSTRLWTRDRRLRDAAEGVGVAHRA